MQMFDWLLKPTPGPNTQQPKFHVEAEPRIIETNSNIIVTSYTSKARQGIVPCRYCWHRTKNGVTTTIEHIKGSTYMCQPADLGTVIKVDIASLDEEHAGTTTVQFPPVRIDLLTRKQVEGVLSSGQGTFTVFLEAPDRERECTLKLSDSLIRLIDNISQTSYKFEYTIAEPRIDPNLRDPTKLSVSFTERYEDELFKFLSTLFDSSRVSATEGRLDLRFANRSAKDIFLYAQKAFVAKKEVKTASLLNKIENSDLANVDTFNYSMELHSLKIDMTRLLDYSRELCKDKEFYISEVSRLEEELQSIIVTYTRIIEDRCQDQQDLDRSYAVLTDKRSEILMKKCAQLEIDHRELTRRVQILTEENAQLKSKGGNRIFQGSFTKKPAPFEEIDCKMEELSQVNIKLQEENRRLRLQQGHDKSMQNLLDSLDESALQPDPKLQSEKLMQLQREKQAIARQLNHVLKKNEQLQKSLSRQSQQYSVKDPKRRNAGDVPVDTNRLVGELSQLKNDNQKLVRQNVELKSASRQNIEVQNSRLNESSKVLSIASSPIRGYNADTGEVDRLKREVDQLNSVNLMLQQRSDTLIIENSELKKKIAFLEKELRDAQLRLNQVNPGFSISPIIAEKDSVIKELESQIAVLRQQLHNASHIDNSKLRKKIDNLIEENKMIRKGKDVMNRSRDLSMEMQNYYEQENAAIKQQNDLLKHQNQNMQQKYLKEARESNRLRSQLLAVRGQFPPN